jgi:hypothetical protein
MGQSLSRPLGRGRKQRFLGRVLGEVEVSVSSDDGTEDLGR